MWRARQVSQCCSVGWGSGASQAKQMGVPDSFSRLPARTGLG
ncbi:hypothetical protein OOU_Y34scaffold00162g63 [Pyricularia oryzae Y34]|uniref:Uncharacterized protein n=3 Tax=Pyricularia oryzae TaxID=318829 RepID=A0A4P7N237_PYROR|nr:hypothetical protein OOU_Y34scaffold00162g63 [Pyricularia oryzae Y34]QBZ56488.1 hypothetical protein PoMZ_01397 [Pyricularia oryzae]